MDQHTSQSHESEQHIAKLGTILGIWAHPDDESWTAAGILATAISNGQHVACITATRGEAGQTSDEARWPQAELGTIREKELDDALACLGIDEHFWLNYRDGELAEEDETQAVQKIASIIRSINPDTILTFGPDGLTGHPDHQTVGAWAAKAIESAKSNATLYWACVDRDIHEAFGKACDAKHNIYFNIDTPPLITSKKADIYLRLPEHVFQQKIDALHAQASQMHSFLDNEESRNCFLPMMSVECFCKKKV